MVFERLKAKLRTLRSLSSFTRREWRIGNSFQQREEEEEKLLAGLEQTVGELNRLSAEQAAEIDKMLAAGELDIERLAKRQRQLEQRMQQIVTTTSDVMTNNLKLATDLLGEFAAVLEVLKKKIEEVYKYKATHLTIGTAAEKQELGEDLARIVNKVTEVFEKLMFQVESLKVTVQEDLDVAAKDFRGLNARVISGDLLLARADTLRTIAIRDLQTENVYLRDERSFRQHVYKVIQELKKAIKTADMKASYGNYSNSPVVEEISQDIDVFVEVYFNFLKGVRQSIADEYKMLNEDLKEAAGIYERINNVMRDIERAKAVVANNPAQKKRVAVMERKLVILNTRLKDRAATTSMKITADAANVRKNEKITIFHTNTLRVGAAIMALVIGVGAVAVTARAGQSPTQRQETIIVKPSAEEKEDMAQRAKRAAPQRMLRHEYMNPALKDSLQPVIDKAMQEFGNYDRSKFEVKYIVKSFASPDRKMSANPDEDKKFADNNLSKYAAPRAETVVAQLQATIGITGDKQGFVKVELANPPGEVAPLPDGVTLEEARAVAAWVDVAGHAPRNDREKQIHDYLESTRSTQITIIVIDKESRKPVTIVTPPVIIMPFIMPIVAPTPPMEVRPVRTLPRLQSVQTVRQGGQGKFMEQKKTVSRDYVRDFENDLRNKYLASAQTVRKNMTADEGKFFDAKYGLRLLRNEWNAIRFVQTLADMRIRVSPERYQKLMTIRDKQFGSAEGMMQNMLKDYSIEDKPELNRLKYG